MIIIITPCSSLKSKKELGNRYYIIKTFFTNREKNKNQKFWIDLVVVLSNDMSQKNMPKSLSQLSFCVHRLHSGEEIGKKSTKNHLNQGLIPCLNLVFSIDFKLEATSAYSLKIFNALFQEIQPLCLDFMYIILNKYKKRSTTTEDFHAGSIMKFFGPIQLL